MYCTERPKSADKEADGFAITAFSQFHVSPIEYKTGIAKNRRKPYGYWATLIRQFLIGSSGQKTGPERLCSDRSHILGLKAEKNVFWAVPGRLIPEMSSPRKARTRKPKLSATELFERY
jgi:hypothetical protein